MLDRMYADYAWERASALLAIDSPTGFTKNAAIWVREAFASLGYNARITNKGGVVVDLGGPDGDDGLMLCAHTDTLGAMVSQIKPNGRLKLTGLGGMEPNNGECENIRLYTRAGDVYEGTLYLCNPSVHVNDDYHTTRRTWETTEVVLDELVFCEAEARKLGIEVGDIVCFDPRTRRTASGYLKSRFLDDKLSVGILLSFAKYLKDNAVSLKRHLWMHVTVYEEVGHGACASVPVGLSEAISVDMGCVGDGCQCTERDCSICVTDSRCPYNYDVVTKLIAAAKREEAAYAVDVYPHYGSDVDDTLKAGADVRHGLIGSGVFSSHGYERSHIDGVYNTLLVLKGYLEV